MTMLKTTKLYTSKFSFMLYELFSIKKSYIGNFKKRERIDVSWYTAGASIPHDLKSEPKFDQNSRYKMSL